MTDVPLPEPFQSQKNRKLQNRKLQNHNSLLSNLSSSKYLDLLPISPQGYYPPQGFPNYPPSAYALLPQPLDVPASSTPAIPISISIEERPRLRRRSEPLRKEYATAPMEEDRLSVSSLKSTNSTRTTDSVRDRDDYLKQSERLFILQPFTVGALKNMRNYEGQTPAGDRKTDVLARAVQLVKTKTEIVDFILAACPYK
ncbi:hypothetical protein TVAGG3_0541740 [Trichomonas vaginalis G3]|uniref:hypothetical protein n=1 Tax=Trichomonas vaginalis (strain ATCC PRA-98 / G3) TaxID=412133 RepID=UPI0021E52BFF|nr:hypothetical protein TVAGG3_0541740 [Trichomonas vaginalis G3]KAI5519882.1 hypothetical protein TVAGG3_0541740 [Trichomonas vaginalis G3]